MFITDFDGTITRNNGTVPKEVIAELDRISKLNICRVIATGRNLFSFTTAVGHNFPIDYLIFSSGIGIYDWKNKKLLFTKQLNKQDTTLVFKYLKQNKYTFTVHYPAPDNHYFHKNSQADCVIEDFEKRLKNYKRYGNFALNTCPSNASQFVVICSDKQTNDIHVIKEKFKKLNIIMATSPINGKSIWIEIFPPKISKAGGIKYLQNKHKINIENIICVGNDYYDISMLDFALNNNSYIVDNAPHNLKINYKIIASNEDNGVAKLLEKLYI